MTENIPLSQRFKHLKKEQQEEKKSNEFLMFAKKNKLSVSNEFKQLQLVKDVLNDLSKLWVTLFQKPHDVSERF